MGRISKLRQARLQHQIDQTYKDINTREMHFSLKISSVGQAALLHAVILVSMTTKMASSPVHGFQGCPGGSLYANHMAEDRKDFKE